MGIGVKVLTGLHIGGSKEYYGIGGIDNPVIKNPLNGQPIIPGSSLKGKIRSLLVLSGHEDLRLFEPDSIGPSRAIFRDMKLSEDSVTFLNENLGFGVFTEAKTESKNY